VARQKVGNATVPTDQIKFTSTETFKINQCASVVCLFKYTTTTRLMKAPYCASKVTSTGKSSPEASNVRAQNTLHSQGTFLLLLESTHVPRPVFVTVISCSRSCENARVLAAAFTGFIFFNTYSLLQTDEPCPRNLTF